MKRRTVLAGMSATAAVSALPAMAARSFRDAADENDIGTQLDVLVDQVKQSSMIIDPSINRVGALYDFGPKGERRLIGIMFQREDGSPIVEPAPRARA